MEQSQMMPLSFIVVRRGCPFCHLAKKAVIFVNMYLPYNKRIEIYDNYLYEELGFMSHPFIQKMLDEKTFDGYPYIYINGGVIEPAPMECLIISIAEKLSAYLIKEIRFGGRIIFPNQQLN